MGRGSIMPASVGSAALRPAPLLGAVLVAAGLVAGCGGSDGSAGTSVKAAARAATSATIAQVRIVPQAKANRVPLGARETGVRDRLGKPEAVLASSRSAASSTRPTGARTPGCACASRTAG